MATTSPRNTLYSPPPWRDVVGSIISTGGSMLNFVLLLFGYVRYGRIRGPEWILLLSGPRAGLASGFKSQVVFPFFCALVAAWLTNRLGSRHWAFFGSRARAGLRRHRANEGVAMERRPRQRCERLVRPDNGGGCDAAEIGRRRVGLSGETRLRGDCRPALEADQSRPNQRLPRKTT